ncbi:hypothetical protein ACJW30_01G326600 [Castanea mollissima]
MINLVPAITFVLASILDMEKLNFGSMRTIAKMLGTILCAIGAVCMALLMGPNCCCWALWLILQVPASTSYPDHLSLSAWMCFSATVQSAILVSRSGLTLCVQAYGACVSQRSPIFPAMFNPVCTVIVTILAAVFLHEQIYTGRLIGVVVIIIAIGLNAVLWEVVYCVPGIYAGHTISFSVLWSKAKDHAKSNENANIQTNEERIVNKVKSSKKISWKIDLEEPLLAACNVDETNTIRD